MRWLQWGDTGTAGTEKHSLEERQRAERKVRASHAPQCVIRTMSYPLDTQGPTDFWAIDGLRILPCVLKAPQLAASDGMS